MSFLDAIKKVFSSKEERNFTSIIEEAYKELQANKINYWSIKPNEFNSFKEVLNLSDKEKVAFILYALKSIDSYNKGRTSYSTADKEYIENYLVDSFYQHLLKTKLQWDEIDATNISDAFFMYSRGQWANFMSWPLALFVNQVERNFDSGNLPKSIKDILLKLQSEIGKLKAQLHKDNLKLLNKIETILFTAEHGEEIIKPTLFLGDDEFAAYANKSLTELYNDDKQHWYKLIALAQKTSGSKPSTRYLDQSRQLFKGLGADKFKKQIIDWFEFIIRMKEIQHNHSYTYGNGQTYNYSSYDFLTTPNIDAVKGLVWMCAHFYDTKTLQVLASLAERSFKKIPGRGPAAAAIGNACLYTLFKSKGLEGIGHLSRLKLRVKQNSTQTLIDKYLLEAAKQQGVTVSEIEDLAVDDFELIDGKREFELEGFRFVVEILSVGDVEMTCFKPDGGKQKSIPTIVKEKSADKIKKLKELVKKIAASTSAQRDRIDRMLRGQRIMSWEYFNNHYASHGLMSTLTKGIIWKFETDNESVEVIYHNNSWLSNKNQVVQPTNETKVSLWHPVTSDVKNIQDWRTFILDNKIVQPIKQAFREVYILTDAEVNTKTYSNRMAAHLLKQHQFNSLTKTRGWKYSLLGAFDDGRYNEAAELLLPEYGLRAEFWVNEVNTDGAYNDTGIWNYVATDQVRFVGTDISQPVDLINVPKIPFSEIMRDVDLFVGVASVGNDPTWNDSGGIPAYRDYWQSYSFGELSEIAKSRKEILTRLVPRLKIASIASIQDKFLVVKGKLRTYKIHIGSTNILMEPNDQYLCIVPDRSQKTKSDNLFLPFEGDTGLSVVLSKAFLLAEDDKITDTTITSQINLK